MKTTKKISLISVLIILLGCMNIARADVCFLPDGKDCEMVPYEEYGGTPNNPRNCFTTKEEAMSARTDSLDSYYQNGDMWCLKQSCSGYNVTSMMPGGWVCLNCNDPQSLNYNKYKCSCDLVGLNPKSGYAIDLERCEEKPNACPSNSTTNCVSDECHKCERADADNPIYSGSEECLVYNTVDAHCPKGYVPDKPSGKCYSTQDMLCGEGKCYQAATTIPDCSGEGKQLSDDNGACWCSCKEGYHDDGNGNCVEDNETIYTAGVYCNNTLLGYAECTFTDNGYYFDNVYVKLQGNITNNNPNENYRTILKGKTEKFYMGVSGGTCYFNFHGQNTRFPVTMSSSSSIYCEYKYKIGEYGHILRVY